MKKSKYSEGQSNIGGKSTDSEIHWRIGLINGERSIGCTFARIDCGCVLLYLSGIPGHLPNHEGNG